MQQRGSYAAIIRVRSKILRTARRVRCRALPGTCPSNTDSSRSMNFPPALRNVENEYDAGLAADRRKAPHAASVSRFHPIFTVDAATSADRGTRSPALPFRAIPTRVSQVSLETGVAAGEHAPRASARRSGFRASDRQHAPSWQDDFHQAGNALSTAPGCCGSAITLLSRSGSIGSGYYICIEIEKWYLPKFLFSYSSE